ncbi:MAG: type II toxin-antitoxin system death-on-curing family toxin, partial [Chryseotalea sp.]
MIDLNEVEKIHEILIERFGGAKGIRDKGLLESSISRPFQTFDGQELYPHVFDKAAA